MRKKIVAGNWKMNETLQEGVQLAKDINDLLKADKPNCDVVICTPFIHLASVAPVLDKEIVGLGAENCADKEKGAYTGEVSAAMVKSTGADYVILGHSERRQYYHETAEILKEKTLLALKNNLKVIFCCGETLEEREQNKQNEVVKAELDQSIFNLTAEEWKNIVIAYEPIWAIGTGKTATSDEAEEMLAYIRSIVAEKYGQAVADETSILYGGSCKPSNAKELFAKPDIDGGLIGGASLKAADFMKLMREKRQIVELDPKLAHRSVNEGFSGGEKKRNEIFQMAMLEPKLSILDETDSGLDVDAMRIVANGVNKMHSAETSAIVITHYERLLDMIKPDVVHVLWQGRIVKTAGPELAKEIEKLGYDWIKEEVKGEETQG